LRRKIPLLKGFIDEENKKFRSELTEMENELRDAEEEYEKDEEHIKDLKKCIEGLETKRIHLANAKRQLDRTCFKNNIITECRDLFVNISMNVTSVCTKDLIESEEITPGVETPVKMNRPSYHL